MNDNYYCDSMERQDEEIFNRLCQDQEWFNEPIHYNKKGSRLDATAIDKKGRKITFEIKQRTGKYSSFKDFIDRYETIYLDYGKMNEFSELMRKSGATLGEGEAFVSIFDKGDTIIIHDMCKPHHTLHMPLQKVYNPATHQNEIEHKIGYYWYDADIYMMGEDKHYHRLSKEEIKDLIFESKAGWTEAKTFTLSDLILDYQFMKEDDPLKKPLGEYIERNKERFKEELHNMMN